MPTRAPILAATSHALQPSLVLRPNSKAVNAFYRANSHKAKCGATDELFALVDSDEPEKFLAVVRLVRQPRCATHDVRFLRSLCVAVPLRRRGLGTRLTAAATSVPNCRRFMSASYSSSSAFSRSRSEGSFMTSAPGAARPAPGTGLAVIIMY